MLCPCRTRCLLTYPNDALAIPQHIRGCLDAAETSDTNAIPKQQDDLDSPQGRFAHARRSPKLSNLAFGYTPLLVCCIRLA